MDINQITEFLKPGLEIVLNRVIQKVEGVIPSPNTNLVKDIPFSIYRVGESIRIDLKGV